MTNLVGFTVQIGDILIFTSVSLYLPFHCYYADDRKMFLYASPRTFPDNKVCAFHLPYIQFL